MDVIIEKNTITHKTTEKIGYRIADIKKIEHEKNVQSYPIFHSCLLIIIFTYGIWIYQTNNAAFLHRIIIGILIFSAVIINLAFLINCRKFILHINFGFDTLDLESNKEEIIEKIFEEIQIRQSDKNYAKKFEIDLK
jgi:hypothetical protein